MNALALRNKLIIEGDISKSICMEEDGRYIIYGDWRTGMRMRLRHTSWSRVLGRGIK